MVNLPTSQFFLKRRVPFFFSGGENLHSKFIKSRDNLPVTHAKQLPYKLYYVQSRSHLLAVVVHRLNRTKCQEKGYRKQTFFVFRKMSSSKKYLNS